MHFALSSKITTNCGNAKKAGDELGDVYVVDTHSLSSGMGLLVLYAAELAQKGLSAKEIYDRVTARVPKVQASFVVDTMEYLHKGGRCSGLANFAATLLKIKPTILLVDGRDEGRAEVHGFFFCQKYHQVRGQHAAGVR